MSQEVMSQRDIASHPEAAAWMGRALAVSKALWKLVDGVGKWSSWLILPVVLITFFDASIRKFIPQQQVWLVENVSGLFGSTILQELEWHFHTWLFAWVLGYGYIYNAHVRVDLIRENLTFRRKAWLEFWGLTLFMIPFCAIIIWFAYEWVENSYILGEISASQVGLTHRWIIKSILLFGLVWALLGGVSIWLQIVVALSGPPDARFELSTIEWPEEDVAVEGKERLVLDFELDDEEEPADDEPAAGGSAR